MFQIFKREGRFIKKLVSFITGAPKEGEEQCKTAVGSCQPLLHCLQRQLQTVHDSTSTGSFPRITRLASGAGTASLICKSFARFGGNEWPALSTAQTLLALPLKPLCSEENRRTQSREVKAIKGSSRPQPIFTSSTRRTGGEGRTQRGCRVWLLRRHSQTCVRGQLSAALGPHQTKLIFLQPLALRGNLPPLQSSFSS